MSPASSLSGSARAARHTRDGLLAVRLSCERANPRRTHEAPTDHCSLRDAGVVLCRCRAGRGRRLEFAGLGRRLTGAALASLSLPSSSGSERSGFWFQRLRQLRPWWLVVGGGGGVVRCAGRRMGRSYGGAPGGELLDDLVGHGLIRGAAGGGYELTEAGAGHGARLLADDLADDSAGVDAPAAFGDCGCGCPPPCPESRADRGAA